MFFLNFEFRVQLFRSSRTRVLVFVDLDLGSHAQGLFGTRSRGGVTA